MKTVSVSVAADVLGSIRSGDAVVLKAGKKSITLRAVPDSGWKRPTKAELRRACEIANAQDKAGDDLEFMMKVQSW